MDIFIHLLYFCPPQPRLSAIVCGNAGKVYFVYYRQTERSLKTRIAEHKKAVASFDQNSKVTRHVHQFSHNMNFANVKVVGFKSNYHERLFREAWHSTLDPNNGNDHIVLPEAYKGRHHASMNNMVTRTSFALRYFKQ